MTLLAPLWLAAATMAALGVVALHFITTQRPSPAMLPTARFVPEGSARAAAGAARPADLALLALRVATLLLLGVAFARPVTRRAGPALARVLVVDRSRGARPDVGDSALALWRPGDALVLFDSAARRIGAGERDTLRALAAVAARGSLSAGLVAAARSARDVAMNADSLELVVVSPFTADEPDAATQALFAAWPGRARIVRTRAAVAMAADVLLVSAQPDDPLRPVLAQLAHLALTGAKPAPGVPRATVRVVRDPFAPSDSAAARDGSAVVLWIPAAGDSARARGVWAEGVTLVAPLVAEPVPAAARVLARWSDGTPAAVESALGRGCLRTVGIGIPLAGDVVLQPAFAALARALVVPCEPTNVAGVVPDSVVRALARSGPAANAASFLRGDQRSPLTPWLLGVAFVVLVSELAMRRAARVEE